MNFIRFPYKEKTLEGVFGLGVRTQNLSIRYDVALSSDYDTESRADKCFDGNSLTICHTKANLNGHEYLQIHFYDVKFKIERFCNSK